MIRKTIYTIFILLVFSNLLQAQISSSSYKKRMKTTYANPKANIPALLDSSDIYLKTDYTKSFDFLEQAYLLSLKNEYSDYRVPVLRKLGDFYAYYNQHDLAALNYDKSLSKAHNKYNQKHRSELFEYLLKAGEQYILAKQPKKSIEIYRKYQVRGLSSLNQFRMNEALGDAYFAIPDYNNALKYYKMAEQNSYGLANKDYQANIKLKIAKLYVATNDAKALEKLEEVKQQAPIGNSTSNSVVAKGEMANYYQNNSMYDKEIDTRNSLIITLDSIGSMDDVSEDEKQDLQEMKCKEQIKIAQTYNKQEFYDSTIDILNNGFVNTSGLDEDINSLELKKEATKTLSEAYLKSGQKEKALKSYEEYVKILDELYRKKELAYSDVNSINKQLLENQGRIDFLEKDKELYDAELEILAQERQIQKDKLRYQWWSIFGLVVVIGLLVFAIFSMRQKSKIQQKHNMMLDLKALRTQMNPHFIFNALNSVNNFIAKNDELNANKYLVRFSKLMRSILDNSDLDFIPLSKEIELLELYLQLENMRFPDKFNFEFEVDKSIDIKQFEIPPMLIQPHIENAIWHGLRYKEQDGKLSVRLNQEGEYLKITVEDNGIGRTKSKELKTDNQKATKSRGIKNTEKRMEILSKIYKQKIRIEISDVEADGSGTRVEIWIPKAINSRH